MRVKLGSIEYDTGNSFIELTVVGVDGVSIIESGYIGENLYGDAMFFKDVENGKLNEPGKNVMVSDFGDGVTDKIYIDVNENKSAQNIIKETCSLLNTMAIFERENTL